MSVRSYVAVTSAAAAVLSSGLAFAHVGVTSPGFANQTQVLTFSVGHGCEGADTSKIEVTIPDGVTQVRGVPNAFGAVEVIRNDADVVTTVVWNNPQPKAADDYYYQLQIRAKLPDAPFTTVLFPTKQTCKDKDGKEIVADWKATAEEAEAAGDSEEGPLPAPAVAILPARKLGWNKFAVKSKLTDLTVFDDAQIVWAGDAAYSSNPATQEQIKNEDGVTELKEIAANTDIWVKY
jgi:periplasmic copper chaperone A